MSILPSSAAHVAQLIDELRSDDALRRETAAARLAVIGERAVEKLLTVAADARVAVASRVAALQALESIGDARAVTLAIRLADGSDDRAIGGAAVGVLGAVARAKDARALAAFEWLTSTALNPSAREDQRLAALAALDGLSSRQVAPIYAALEQDASPRVAARATRQQAADDVSIERMADGEIGDDPMIVAAVIRDEGATAKVTLLRRLVELIRQREKACPAETRQPWTAARGLLHQLLAERGSRLALYDLRETLEHASTPLPVGFLSAAATIGDVPCLPPLAAAWVSAPPDQRWWAEHLADAFRSIVTREQMTRRHPVLRDILQRWPSAGVLVASAKKK